MNLFSKWFSSYRKKTEKKENDFKVQSKFMPDNDVPVDEQFMLNFKEKGGKFLYCESLKDATKTLDNILLENNWHESNVCCFEPEIKKMFGAFNLKFSKDLSSSFYFSSCEHLIADTGGILVSSNQLKEKKLYELPENIVILSYTSQLVKSISEGLKGIKSRPGNSIPTNITTIQLFESQQEENNFMTYGSSAKNLYLLLVEDL